MGRGSSGIGSVGGGSSGSLVGKRVTDLGITFDNIEKKLELTDTSAAQKNKLLDMFRGMEKNDYSYDGQKTPYEIKGISITQPFIDSEFGRSIDIQVSIETGGNTGRYLVDSMDRRYRMFFIGKNGGVYTYSEGGKRKTVSGFEFMNGKRDL